MDGPNPASRSDEDLMASYQQGRAAAFEELFDRYRDRVHGFLVQAVGDRERAAELFQETFLRLHDSRRRYDPGRPFAPWLFRIARNLVANELRRRGRARESTAAPETLEQAAAQGAGEDPVEEEEMQDQLRAALVALPAQQREAIAMSFFAGLRYAQIAALVDASEDAVKQRVRRGLAALRERMQRHLAE